MILEQYDKEKWGILRPDHLVRKIKDFPQTVVCEFSKGVIEKTAQAYGGIVLGNLISVAGNTPIYKIKYKGTELGICQAWIGAPACISNMEEIVAMGAKNIFVCGECGVLDANIDDAHFIIPTAAVRDEGTGYHYLPPSDEVDMPEESVKIIEEEFRKKNIRYTKGKIWTTDAPYRETVNKMEKRKKQGCIAVDMEISALIAFSKMRNIRYGQFVYAADNLDAEEWQQRGLTIRPVKEKMSIFEVALDCAIKLQEAE